MAYALLCGEAGGGVMRGAERGVQREGCRREWGRVSAGMALQAHAGGVLQWMETKR